LEAGGVADARRERPLTEQRGGRAGPDHHTRERIREPDGLIEVAAEPTGRARMAGSARPPVGERREVRQIVVGVADALDDRDPARAIAVGELGEARVQPDRTVEVERGVDRERGAQASVVRSGVRDHRADAVVATGELDEDDGTTLLPPELRRTRGRAGRERAAPGVDRVAAGDDGAGEPEPGEELPPTELVLEIEGPGHDHTTAYSGDATTSASRR